MVGLLKGFVKHAKFKMYPKGKGTFFFSKDCHSQIILQSEKDGFEVFFESGEMRKISFTAIQIKQLAMVRVEFW